MSSDPPGIDVPVGETGSGFARYAAAMALYQQGLIGEDTLEVFRICAPDDRLDPHDELRRLGLVRDLDLLRALLT